jgi:glycosyltransferase involved in cell wall biosynthesis
LPGEVTCVVPALNAAPWIEETLRSILGQTQPPVEVIVVDGGSDDGTPALATAVDARVRVGHDPGQSPPASRNRGIREAGTDFVAFLDADDLWHPEKLERQLARFAERPELDALATHVQNFWDDGHETEADHYRDHRRMQPIPGYAMNTVLARRSAFLEKVGLLNPDRRFSDGAEWFIRAREAGAVYELMDDVLAYHRLHGTNMSRRDSEAGEEEFLTLVKSVLDRRRGREPE